jgi:MFS transporter, DHA1 family, tetracycline resistance protein
VAVRTGRIPPEAAQGLSFERVLPLFLLVLVDVLGLTLVLPLLHLYGAQFGANAFQIGLIAAAFPLAQLVGVPVMGALSDRYGRKPLLLFSQITTCISFVILAMAGSLEVVILSRVIDGLFGANIATAQAALSDLTDRRYRTQALGLTGMAFGIGFVLGPILSIAALEISGQLSVPAWSAAAYSLVSIGITWFLFEETLPPGARAASTGGEPPTTVFSLPGRLVTSLRMPRVGGLLVLMFAQQFFFFAFQSLLGLFLLSRLGLLGQGSALIFLVVGITLVVVQGRYLGRWSRRYGEERLILAALVLLGAGLLLLALTPANPHPFYVQRIAENRLADQAGLASTGAMLGDMGVTLPADGNNGLAGVLWVSVIVIPIAAGAGMIRPSLNSLLTSSATARGYGSILGISAAMVSAANALAPIAAGWLFQHYGDASPYLWTGAGALVLAAISQFVLLRHSQHQSWGNQSDEWK